MAQKIEYQKLRTAEVEQRSVKPVADLKPVSAKGTYHETEGVSDKTILLKTLMSEMVPSLQRTGEMIEKDYTKKVQSQAAADFTKGGEYKNTTGWRAYEDAYFKMKGEADARKLAAELKTYTEENWQADPAEFEAGKKKLIAKYSGELGVPAYAATFGNMAIEAEGAANAQYKDLMHRDTVKRFNEDMMFNLQAWHQEYQAAVRNGAITQDEADARMREKVDEYIKMAKSIGLRAIDVTTTALAASSAYMNNTGDHNAIGWTKVVGKDGIAVVQTASSPLVEKVQMEALNVQIRKMEIKDYERKTRAHEATRSITANLIKFFETGDPATLQAAEDALNLNSDPLNPVFDREEMLMMKEMVEASKKGAWRPTSDPGTFRMLMQKVANGSISSSDLRTYGGLLSKTDMTTLAYHINQNNERHRNAGVNTNMHDIYQTDGQYKSIYLASDEFSRLKDPNGQQKFNEYHDTMSKWRAEQWRMNGNTTIPIEEYNKKANLVFNQIQRKYDNNPSAPPTYIEHPEVPASKYGEKPPQKQPTSVKGSVKKSAAGVMKNAAEGNPAVKEAYDRVNNMN